MGKCRGGEFEKFNYRFGNLMLSEDRWIVESRLRNETTGEIILRAKQRSTRRYGELSVNSGPQKETQEDQLTLKIDSQVMVYYKKSFQEARIVGINRPLLTYTIKLNNLLASTKKIEILFSNILPNNPLEKSSKLLPGSKVIFYNGFEWKIGFVLSQVDVEENSFNVRHEGASLTSIVGYVDILVYPSYERLYGAFERFEEGDESSSSPNEILSESPASSTDSEDESSSSIDYSDVDIIIGFPDDFTGPGLGELPDLGEI